VIIHDLPEREYHASGHVGIHALCDFGRRGPGYFYHKHVARTFREKDGMAFEIGKLAHKIILEGEKAYFDGMAIRPLTYPGKESDKKGAPIVEKPWNGNATVCKEWMQQAADAGRVVVAPEDDACVRAMLRRTQQNPDSRALLAAGTPELTIRQEEQGVPIQCRVDWMTGGIAPMEWTAITDLKTCDDLNGFTSDIYRYRYDRQAAWYQWMVSQEIGMTLPFLFLAVEKAPPHRVGVYRCSERALARAHEVNMADLDRLSDYWERQEWPAGDPEGIQEVDLPDWLAKQSYDILGAA
jgi:hypothetical protein